MSLVDWVLSDLDLLYEHAADYIDAYNNNYIDKLITCHTLLNCRCDSIERRFAGISYQR